jgi:hypothetical protein
VGQGQGSKYTELSIKYDDTLVNHSYNIENVDGIFLKVLDRLNNRISPLF